MFDKTPQRFSSESGQSMVFVLLALGLFLVAAVGFAVDIANLWFHRQTAQSAADSACAAGSMDILAASQGASTGDQGFTIGTAFSCATTPGATPCEYAALNGYSGTNTTPGNQATISFPSSDPDVSNTTPPLPPSAMAPNPFIRVDIVDNVQTFFSGLLTGNQTQAVRAFAVCGGLLVQSPTPILVLDPKNPSSGSALTLQNSPSITIYGGPERSIQVNSSSSSAVSMGSASINLSQGGPNLTGSSIGVYGGPTTAPGGVTFGSTGSWEYPAAPISDPFATLCEPGQTGCPQVNGNPAPAKPGTPQVPADEAAKGCNSIPCTIAYHDAGHGCPSSGGCLLYTAGYYASAITIKSNKVAVFDPGLYYIVGGLSLQSNSTVRPSTGAGDGSGGTTFFFSGSSTITVAATAGKSTTDAYVASSLRCTGTSTLPGNLPVTTAIQGNVLVAPCTGYYGDPLGSNDPSGIQRGILFFQDRSASGVSPSWGGGSQSLSAGTMYFHHCNSSGTGTGCGAPSTYYDAGLSMSGSSCGSSYMLGTIVADNLSISGSSCITMDLNPNPAYWSMKATMVR